MYRLFSFDYEGSTFAVFGTAWSGLECLVLNGREVARKRNFRSFGEYQIETRDLGKLSLTFRVLALRKQVSYELRRNGSPVAGDTVPMGMPPWATRAAAASAAVSGPSGSTSPTAPATSRHPVAWIGILLKIFQSGKVLKVALAGVAVSGWTVLYSWPFAVALTATIVFHEYGHLRAMRHFGMKTKGMYLIPFVGGVAVGENAKTHWQDVFIAMMGPMFGLAMSVAFYLLYLATNNHLAGLVASMSALVNVINLLPVHPLDGGRVVRALVFSGGGAWAFRGLLAISAACFALSVYAGLYLLSFFIVIGATDLLGTWSQRAADPKTPLDSYGIWFSLVWFLLVLAAFVGIILLIADSELPGSGVAVRILKS